MAFMQMPTGDEQNFRRWRSCKILYSGITECKVQAFIQNREYIIVMKCIHKKFRGNSECKEMAE
jgi:hypothetical protein